MHIPSSQACIFVYFLFDESHFLFVLLMMQRFHQECQDLAHLHVSILIGYLIWSCNWALGKTGFLVTFKALKNSSSPGNVDERKNPYHVFSLAVLSRFNTKLK